ncbi:MAG: hypothetical protein Q9222_005503 [Ikaeria aurantiellina]
MIDFQRLYVSPLDDELLTVILPASLRSLAQNITYHGLQTFPGKRYGYLELPTADAVRLKARLNGSIFRGMRMKVETARPKKDQGNTKEVNQANPKETKEGKNTTKAQSKDKAEVLPGVELENGRKVKRGWTGSSPSTPKDWKTRDGLRGKKGKQSVTTGSVHGEGPECLFKTNIPPNASANGSQLSPSLDTSKKRKRGVPTKGTTVHEFEHTTKHASFLRDKSNGKNSKPTSTYVEGKGWLDEDGNVVEAARQTRSLRSRATSAPDQDGDPLNVKKSKSKQVFKRDPRNTSKSTSVGDYSQVAAKQPSLQNNSPFVTEDSGSSSEREAQEGKDLATGDTVSGESSSSEDEVNTEQVRGLSLSRSSPTPPLKPSKEVHPLEALFKRPGNAASQTPRKPSLEVKTEFSFFDPDADAEGSIAVSIPQTPFTQQDFQERRHRSAAPTPDTAAPGKTSFGRVWSQDSDPGDSESEDEAPSRSTPTAQEQRVDEDPNGGAKDSEFRKWFYEHRGETNRTWKRRRREAAKEKRQKENKRR